MMDGGLEKVWVQRKMQGVDVAVLLLAGRQSKALVSVDSGLGRGVGYVKSKTLMSVEC